MIYIKCVFISKIHFKFFLLIQIKLKKYIKNDKILNNDDIKPWLLKNCQKWIILNEESNIYIILSSNKSSRLDSIVRSLKSFIFLSNENAKDNLKITTKKFAFIIRKKNDDDVNEK